VRYDFAFFFVVLTALTGGIWLIDSLLFAPRRRKAAAAAGAAEGQQPREPVIVEYSRAFFPVILIILLVRSFLGEPYRIPSGSMMPTLLIGDFILVNKFAYGLRLPVLDTKIVPIGEPQRGDVIVFHPPMAPEQAWIKRVIGLPGDTIAYDNYTLTINGQPVPSTTIGAYVGKGSGRDMTGWRELRETLPGHSHRMLQQDLPPMFQHANGVWKVPPGEYFMMGDNRDDSEDSRYWPTHFLPEKNIVGKAVVVWMNWDTGGDGIDASRIGTVIK
jgi:signal peptidase I